MSDVQMFLGVLPNRLMVAAIPRDVLRREAYVWVSLFLSPPPFLSLTETEGGLASLIVDARWAGRLKAALSAGCSVSGVQWRALQVSPGSSPLQDGGIVSAVSGALAKEGFSILYVSSLSADYVLVKADELDAALECLGRAFSVMVDLPDEQDDEVHAHDEIVCAADEAAEAAETVENANEEVEDAASVMMSGGEAESVASVSENGGSSSSEQKEEAAPNVALADEDAQVPKKPRASSSSGAADGAPISLQSLSDRLVLMSIPEGELGSYTQRLLTAVFYPRGERMFFSYVHIEGDSDMVVADSESAELLGEGSGAQTGEAYVALRVAGEWGFDETGLVFAVSEPLSRDGVPVFYCSTFYTDYVRVQEGRHEEAVGVLRDHNLV